VDPKQAGATRARMFDRLEADHTLLCANHFPHPGFGYLARMRGRRIFQAAKPAGASEAEGADGGGERHDHKQ
jgi:hypothetical protein